MSGDPDYSKLRWSDAYGWQPIDTDHPADAPSEPAPCPHCGSIETKIVHDCSGAEGSQHPYFIQCVCDARGPSRNNSADAIAAWNRRSPVRSAQLLTDSVGNTISHSQQDGDARFVAPPAEPALVDQWNTNRHAWVTHELFAWGAKAAAELSRLQRALRRVDGQLQQQLTRTKAAESALALAQKRVEELEEGLVGIIGGNATMESVLFGEMSGDKTVNFTAPLAALRRARALLGDDK